LVNKCFHCVLLKSFEASTCPPSTTKVLIDLVTLSVALLPPMSLLFLTQQALREKCYRCNKKPTPADCRCSVFASGNKDGADV
ncbi:MAG: hypothetical protein ABI656_12760, partial [bacterium]